MVSWHLAGMQHAFGIDGNVGRGEGIVVATGKSTEFGHVFELMQEVTIATTYDGNWKKILIHGYTQVEVRKTPLQISMNDLGKQLSMFSFAVIGVIVLIGIIQKRSWLDMFTIGGMCNWSCETNEYWCLLWLQSVLP